MSTEELAEKAYNAFCLRMNFRGPHGEQLPHWEELVENEREAWIDAAGAVSLTIRNATSPG